LTSARGLDIISRLSGGPASGLNVEITGGFMMKVKWMAVLGVACLVVVGGCGKGGSKATPAEESVKAPEATASSAPAATETAPAKVADQSAITNTGTGIVVTGSGNGEVGPVTLDQPYYIVKAKYESPEEYSMLQVTYKKMMGGTEVEKNVVFVAKGAEILRVFPTEKENQPSVDITFTVKSAGSYTLEFTKPPALDTAQPAPLTVTGGKGYTMTPLVKTAGNYVMLRLKYTGSVDPNKKGGMPLATGDLYDAETGENWVRNQNVYDGNIQSQDGTTRQKPGVYFALISCSKDDGAWEATITE
jgi:hypothetical protein